MEFFAYCKGWHALHLTGRSSFQPARPADRIAIVMTNVTLEVTALLCEKNHLVTTDTSIGRIALLAKSDEIVNPRASVHLSTRRQWHD